MREGKEKKHCWTKSLPDVLVTCLKSKLDKVPMERIQSVYLVIGGDHGQGKFRR